MRTQTTELVSIMQGYSPAGLSALMGISDSLGALNAARFGQWKARVSPRHARQAILAFAGDVYDGLAAHELDAAQLDWAQAHLRILSGLYGVLRPLDLIQPYRLEMGSRLPTGRGTGLYAFWGDQPARALRRAGRSSGMPILVNLASEEYFRSVDLKALCMPVIQPVFEQWHGGRWKIISFDAKRARGAMARYAIDQRIDDPERLKAFDRGGYRHDAASSSQSRWVFRRS